MVRTGPDAPRDDTPRLWFLGPRAEPAVGLSTVRVDLPAFFLSLRRLGRDPALLFLALRALRQRTAVEELRLSDLAWMLLATRDQVVGWLDRLSRARLIVYDKRGVRGPLVIEIVFEPPDPSTWPVDGSILPMPPHEIPTFWLVQVMPRLGSRTTFLVYLYLLSREGAPQERTRVLVRQVAEAVGLRWSLTVHYHLGKLQRHGLVRRTRSGRGLIVLDPPPLTYWDRFRLRLLQWGFLPLPWRRILIASLVISLAMLVLGYLVTHPVHVLLPTPFPDDERPHPVRLAKLLPVE
jgi:DNA-binding MarR family transcriptional regulator